MGGMVKKYEVAIVGSGTSAWYAAKGLHDAGKTIAVIDERPMGGTCALRGCQPKKYLVANAESVAASSQLVGLGIRNPAETDWKALQAHKDDFVKPIPQSEVDEWHDMGIDTYHQRAQMVAENALEVGGVRLEADHIILACGATPRRSDIPGSELMKVSNDFLDLAEMPERVIFVGGGYISFEFAHVAVRAGAKEVTILHRSESLLNQFDADMVQVVVEASRDAGINIVLNEEVIKVEEVEKGCFRATTSSGKAYGADLVIEAIGRDPNLSVLDGGQGNVAHSEKGVEVNEYLQSTSNPRVYAIGDVVALPYMLASVADEEGKVAAENILGSNVRKLDLSVVPSAVFTIPNLAMVGLTEAQAKEQGLDFRVSKGTTTSKPSSKRIGENHSAYKVLIDNQTDLIIGAHQVRHAAAETINIFALAMKYGIPAADLANFIWAYPTMTSDLKGMV